MSYSPSRLTAIVLTYWPRRKPNVERIVHDLQAGSVKPDNIFILNNNPEYVQEPVEGAAVINSGQNFTCRGKYAFAMMLPSDYYILIDDDTSVGTKTIECLMRYARRGCCFGYLGVRLEPGTDSFHHGPRVWPHEVSVETPVDTFCGCIMFMAYDAVVRMLLLDEFVRLPGKWPHQGDDIIAGLANKSSCVPMHGDERFVQLHHYDQSMWEADPDYYIMRDHFTRDVLAARAAHPLPEF